MVHPSTWRAPGALPGSAAEQQPPQGAFNPRVCDILTQELMDTPREEGLGGYLAPTGASHSFQGWVMQR